MGGWKALRGILPAVLVCGGVFATMQFTISNFVGLRLIDILSSLTTLGALVLLSKVWQPADTFSLPGESAVKREHQSHQHAGMELLRAWAPYLVLVAFVLFWGVS
jgi:L-lactate permease